MIASRQALLHCISTAFIQLRRASNCSIYRTQLQLKINKIKKKQAVWMCKSAETTSEGLKRWWQGTYDHQACACSFQAGNDNLLLPKWSHNSDTLLVAKTVSWLHGICFEVILIDVL